MFISKKIIKGKARKYLEKSFRLPDGRVKKISLYLREDKITYGDEERLNVKVDDNLKEFALDNYMTNSILSKDVMERLERIKMNYHKIIRNLSNKQFQDVLDRFTINFTYESNAIEGNSLTLKDVTFVIQENMLPKGKDLREVYETLNTRLAVEWIFSEKPKLNRENIIKLHKILVKDTGIASGFKRLHNFLIGRNVKTTAPEKVEQEMEKLLSWLHNEKSLHPLMLASEFHGRFEKIHPFEDGNGRCGRLLINLILLKHGYPPLIIRKSQRMSYFAALHAFDNKHENKLLLFLIGKYKDTYKKFFDVYVKYL